MKPGTKIVRTAILTFMAGFLLLYSLSPVNAQAARSFQPIPRGEMYERIFLDDFFDALGYRPDGLTWVDESETVRLLITSGSMAKSGDTQNAITTLGLLPDLISSQFPFITTMKEDLLIPEILDPWYRNEEARTYLFSFYEEVWLPHPEYRDDYLSFRDDTIGRASRRDPTVPAVWILGHLADYGFVPDRQLTEDDPYLFIWDLLTGVTVYAQRCTYYGVTWDQYSENTYNRAVIQHVGERIREAHDEAARREVGRGFWADLISSHHPFEAPPVEEEPVTGVVSEEEPAAVPETTEDMDGYDLFRPPPDTPLPDDAEETSVVDTGEMIEGLIEDLDERFGETVPPEEPSEIETIIEGPDEITEVPEEELDDSIPDEFLIDIPPERTPSEIEPEVEPPSELGNYSSVRLKEIADQLAVDIGVLANNLGRETIDLVILYNDVNVSEETIVNAEQRYISKREAFLAGLGVWDRFDMEIYTPLTLGDFNDVVVADLRAPYEEMKSVPAQWDQIEAYEAHFEESFGQIESGMRNRRDEEDILAAEAAALTAFLGEYNDLIKEIEDLLSGAITTIPESNDSIE